MRLGTDSRACLVRHREHGWLVVKRASFGMESQRLREFEHLGYQPGSAASLPIWCYEISTEFARHFVPGRSLREVFHQGPIAARRAQRWIAALARLLLEIHRAGHCHGDISPGNVLLTPAGELVLLDWGESGCFTPAYSAPELRAGTHAGPAQDVYALAMLWQHALLGGLPEHPPALPPLLLQCLHPDPLKRPSVGRLAELDDDLELFSSCLGRTRQFDQLEKIVRQDGERHALWLALPAPSGSGKSEFLREVCASQPVWAWGQGSTLRSPSSFGIFQAISRAPVFADFDISPDRLETTRWQMLLQVFPALRRGREVRQGGVGPLAAQALVTAWAELLQETLSEFGRLLLVVDDAQWMDESSQQLLLGLSQQSLPGLTVLVAWRREEWTPPPELSFHAQLEMEALQLEAVERWLHRDGVELSRLEVHSLFGWSQGLPLLLRYWISQDGFHSKVGLLLEERIEQLTVDQSEILQVAALLGKCFQTEPLEALFTNVVGTLSVAVQLQLLLPPTDEDHSFAHDRIRELFLKQLGDQQRLLVHGRLADYYLSQDVVPESAHHLAEAGQLARAAPLALQAARLESKRLAFDSARRFYEIYFSQEHDLRVWLEYKTVLDGLNQVGLARRKLDEVQRRCADPGIRLNFLETLCELAFQLCDYEAMLAYAVDLHKIGGTRALGLAFYYRMVWAFQCCEEAELKRLMPRVLIYCLLFGKRVPVLAATVTNGLDQQGLFRWTRRWYARLLSCYDREQHPNQWAQIQSRASTYLYSTPDGLRPHLDRLLELEEILEGHGVAFEYTMVLMQMGFYAICCGNFAELLRLSRRLHSVAKIMGSHSMGQVAMHYEVEARGGSYPWRPLALALEGPALHFLGHAHLVVAASRVCVRRGKPELAWRYLNLLPRYGAVYDNAMLFSERATVARILLEKTPRSRPALRQHYLQWGIQAAEDALEAGQLMRPYLAHAQRERAWLWLGQGEEENSRQLFAQSVETARAYGATYQEALSRVAWGRCSWPESEQQLQLGREMLRNLGAWWDLDDKISPALDDLGEAAMAYLIDRDREALVTFGGGALVSELDRLLEDRDRSQLRLEAERLRLQSENDMWEKFLRHGPVLYERRDSRGNLIEGSAVQEAATRINLPDGSVAVFHMPVQRRSFRQLDRLLTLEKHMLDRQIERDLAHLTGEIAAEVRCLPEAVDSFFQLDWKHLDAFSAQNLRAVLREVESNSRKHGKGPLRSQFSIQDDWLVIHFEQERGAAAPSTGFGSEAMRFRLAQVGGEMSVRLSDETYSLTLRLAVRPLG